MQEDDAERNALLRDLARMLRRYVARRKRALKARPPERHARSWTVRRRGRVATPSNVARGAPKVRAAPAG